MLIILPDPTTRRCPRHRDELMTDSVPCIRCEGERIAEEFAASIERHVKDAFARVATAVVEAQTSKPAPKRRRKVQAAA